MQLERQKVTDGSATAKALNYTLKRSSDLTRYIDDGQLPIDNNWIENQIRPMTCSSFSHRRRLESGFG
jgi:transposase